MTHPSAALQQRVADSHSRTFGVTPLRERLRDLAAQVAELSHHRDDAHLAQEAGDVAWSLIQLLNERGLALDEVVDATIRRLDDRRAGRTVALLGTSANPITNAHLTVALEVLALTDVDEVWIYPAGEHPWGKKLMPAQHRVEMIRRAIARYPRIKLCDFEVAHGERIYPTARETAAILRDHLLPAYPGHRFRWIMGSDVAQTFHTWGGADWMAEALDIVVFHRLGYDFDKAGSLLADPRHQYFKEDVVTSNISSSLVRKRGRTYDAEQLIAMVPEVVWDYLREHRLLDPDVLR